MNTIAIVGAGHGGFQLAASLRSARFDGRITLLNGEGVIPYQRPPLSKEYLKTGRSDSLYFRDQAFYADQQIDLISDTAVTIDRAARKVITSTGVELNFDHLVLATGTINRLLDVPGTSSDLIYIKTLDNAQALRERMPDIRRVAVIGGGFIGLEFAAAAAATGISVDVIEMADRLMARTASPMISAFFEAQHHSAGVRFHLNSSVADIARRGAAIVGVTLTDGRRIQADAVVVGIGSLPRQELAVGAGLAVNNGIVVDQYLRTSDPNISAIGDCAAFQSPHAEGHFRLESVQNAVDQAKCLAAQLNGQRIAYAAVPWFWSNQGENRLQIAGLTDQSDAAVMRGSLDDRSFSVFGFRAGRLVGVESVNRAADHLVARRLLTSRIDFDPALISNLAIDLKSLLNRDL